MPSEELGDGDMEWSDGREVGESSEGDLDGKFEDGEGGLNFDDETGSLSRHQMRGVPSVPMTPEDRRLTILRCLFVVSVLFLSLP